VLVRPTAIRLLERIGRFGVYSNLNIAGTCTVDAGSVTVEHNLTVLSGDLLLAVFGGSDIAVGGNLNVQTNGVLVLGCEPVHFICANDPDQITGTLTTTDTVGGDLTAENALSVIVHASVLGHNVTMSGGCGGESLLSARAGSPPMATSRTTRSEATSLLPVGNPAGWSSCVTPSCATSSSTRGLRPGERSMQQPYTLTTLSYASRCGLNACAQ
jgi:hypothetical protein